MRIPLQTGASKQCTAKYAKPFISPLFSLEYNQNVSTIRTTLPALQKSLIDFFAQLPNNPRTHDCLFRGHQDNKPGRLRHISDASRSNNAKQSSITRPARHKIDGALLCRHSNSSVLPPWAWKDTSRTIRRMTDWGCVRRQSIR